jgi:hypothetical protein
MLPYKIITCNLLIFPIINFAFALPIGVQETPRVGGDVVPDVAIMSAKRADKMEEQWGMYFERLHGKPESDLEGLKGLLHYGPPELTKSPSLDHYLTKSPSFDHYLTSPGSSNSPPLDHSVVSAGSEAGLSSQMEKPESTSFLSKVVSKLKFWRRICTLLPPSSPESQTF